MKPWRVLTATKRTNAVTPALQPGRHRSRRAPYCLLQPCFRIPPARLCLPLLPELGRESSPHRPWVWLAVADRWALPRACRTGLPRTFTQADTCQHSMCTSERPRSARKVPGLGCKSRHSHGCGNATSCHLSLNDHVLSASTGKIISNYPWHTCHHVRAASYGSASPVDRQ